MTRGWVVAGSAIVLAGAVFGIGYAVGDDGHGSSDDHGLRGDRMAVMMADGSMPAQMSDFIGMMNELRDQMTPEMLSRMDDDAMWQLMESGELEAMMDEHGQHMHGMPGMGGHGGDGHRSGSGGDGHRSGSGG